MLQLLVLGHELAVGNFQGPPLTQMWQLKTPLAWLAIERLLPMITISFTLRLFSALEAEIMMQPAKDDR